MEKQIKNPYFFGCTVTECHFDPIRDQYDVKPCNDMSISDIMACGSVPDTATPDDYAPEIEDTSQIVGRAQDTFTALRLQSQLIGKAYLAAAAAADATTVADSSAAE